MDAIIENPEGESPEDIITKLRQTFKDEAYELLAELETALLELEKAPRDQELIGRVFRAMHTIKGSSAACEFHEVSSFAHEVEAVLDLARKGDLPVTKAVIDLTLSARDQLKAMFKSYYAGTRVDERKGHEVVAALQKMFRDAGPRDDSRELEEYEFDKKLGEILVDRGVIQPEDLKRALSAQKRIGEILVETGLGRPEKIEEAIVEQQRARELRKERQQTEETGSIRVSVEKLDRLVDAVGELVSVQARLSRTAQSHEIPELLSVSEQVERLTADLHDKTMDIRMLPIGAVFGKYRRVVRDLSRELGKEIKLVTEGAETELDKTVLERLSDPLVHIIRNSIDHGIEPPDVREAAGKPRQGTVRISGTHSGAHVVIQVSDDGAGIDREAVRAQAVEKGLLKPDEDPGHRELLSFLFAPGFSTAKKVTELSGRGVGLDVVKKTIESLRGDIELESQMGHGTTITLKLPLTLAIIDGLLVKIAKDFFVLPLSFVKECVELTPEDKKNSHGRNLANVRGELVPYINLREEFLIAGEPPVVEQIVITETDRGRVGFTADQVLGGNQTVIKNLGTVYSSVEGFSGATILGDGTVALILDVPKLVRTAEQKEMRV
jgi:two-component system chemotaxis sensor kinase CheA